MKCPVCNSIFAASLREIAVEMGQVRSKKKAEIARQNGARGGRPRKSNEQRTNPDSKAIRARGQAYGHISTPVGRGISGVGISINFGMLQGGTGLENGGTEYAVYLTELGYETLIGLGVLCYDTGTASPGNQWWVRPTSLGAYFVLQGFTSFNLDCLNTNTTPNTWAPFRPKSPDEVSENVSYDDNVLGRKLYGWNRYVDLR